MQYYSCAYSNKNKEMFTNNHKYEKDKEINENCMRLNDNTSKVICSRRCTEVYHETYGENGETVGKRFSIGFNLGFIKQLSYATVKRILRRCRSVFRQEVITYNVQIICVTVLYRPLE